MTFITPTRRVSGCTPSLGARIAQSYGIWRQRQALKRLDAAALRDIGVSRYQADAESRRSIWDAPDTWYC